MEKKTTEEKDKLVAVKEAAGIHIFSENMNCPPAVLMHGSLDDLLTILTFGISEFINKAVEAGVEQAKVERKVESMARVAIVASRIGYSEGEEG